MNEYIEKYPKMVTSFYVNNYQKIFSIARKVRKKFYSIPLEVEDIVLLSIFYFNTLEVETEFYEFKIIPYEKFFFARLEYCMLTKCNEYIKNNHKVLNNYLNLEEGNFCCDLNYYSNEELFDFLTKEEFEIIYRIKVLKENKKIIAQDLGLNLTSLRKLEKEITIKIIKQYS